jgi:hypothetical protein
MSQQRRKNYASFLEFLLIVIIVMIGIGCDSILPEDFQKKDFTIAEIDGRACTILSDTVGTAIAPKALESFVDSATLANSTENQVILSNFPVITAGVPQLVQESLMIVDPAGMKTTYAVLTVTQAKDLYIYTSLFYTAENVNEYVTIQLLKSDTSAVAVSNDMTGETVSGGTQTIIVQSQERIVPIIRSRDMVHVEAGTYLVRLAMSNPQTTGKYKITILSF